MLTAFCIAYFISAYTNNTPCVSNIKKVIKKSKCNQVGFIKKTNLYSSVIKTILKSNIAVYFYICGISAVTE